MGPDVNEVTLPHILFLGLGSTAALALYAAAQWWGAYRLGIRLIPIAGWKDPVVRRITSIAVPSAVSSGLGTVGYFTLLVVSGQVAGGTVAFQIGISCLNLPIALCAFPVAFAQLPLLSRHFGRGDLENFQATYQQSRRLALFVTLPACALFLGMPTVIASAVAFGEMVDPSAISLVAGVIAGLSFAIVGESVFVVARSSAFARHDAMTTLHAMLIRLSVIFLTVPLALSADGGPTRLWCVGLSYSAGALAAAGFLLWRSSGALPKVPDKGGLWLMANCLVAVITTLPAIVLARHIEVVDGTSSERLLSAGALLLLSAVLYTGTQYWRRSREFEILSSFAGAPMPASRPASSAGATSGSGEAVP
jgi:peptidoglycan biosynthesis protein MviN/MurJ (putative lipid II flippase)